MCIPQYYSFAFIKKTRSYFQSNCRDCLSQRSPCSLKSLLSSFEQRVAAFVIKYNSLEFLRAATRGIELTQKNFFAYLGLDMSKTWRKIIFKNVIFFLAMCMNSDTLTKALKRKRVENSLYSKFFFFFFLN